MLSRYGALLVSLVFIGAVTFVFSWLLDKQHNPNRGNLTHTVAGHGQEVVLQRNKAGHYVADGEINGSKVQFFLDTGATTISVPENIADTLNLKPGPVMLASTANGTVKVYATRLNRVRLGHIEIANVEASINPAMAGPDILLGMSFLGQLEMLQQGNQLRLRVPSK